MTRRSWTKEEEALLIAAYPDTRTKDIAAMLSRSVGGINQKAHEMKIARSKAFSDAVREGNIRRGKALSALAQTKGNRFKKGHTPWNKGTSHAPPGSQKTQFKRGERPHNTKPIGTERISKGYLEEKTEKGWQPVHRLLWEQHNGPIPRAHVVAFKSRIPITKRDQITLDKLELVSRKTMLRQNSGQEIPELWRLYQLKGAIHRQRNRIINEHKEVT